MDAIDCYDELLFRIDATIERGETMVQYVSTDPPNPPWAYTIGLLTIGHPEIITLGLAPESAAPGLQMLATEIREGHRRPIGAESGQALGGLPIRLLPVPIEEWCEPNHRFAMALNYYGPTGFDPARFEAVQLVWADDRGRFPWDPGFPTRLRRLQPILDPEAGRP